MNLIFDPLAKKEYDEAFDYYEVQEEGLGAKFRRSVWALLRCLSAFLALENKFAPKYGGLCFGDFHTN